MQRWTSSAVDPNRFFISSSRFVLTLQPLIRRAPPSRDSHSCSCEETHLLMTFIESLGVAQWVMHLDLHETTDSDLYEFRPAKASRDGVTCP